MLARSWRLITFLEKNSLLTRHAAQFLSGEELPHTATTLTLAAETTAQPLKTKAFDKGDPRMICYKPYDFGIVEKLEE